MNIKTLGISNTFKQQRINISSEELIIRSHKNTSATNTTPHKTKDPISTHKRNISNISISSVSEEEEYKEVDISKLQLMDNSQFECVLNALKSTPFVRKREEIINRVKQ
jgi:hypothetical protein